MNCQNCKNYVFGRCLVTNLSVGPEVLCNAWELSQSWEMVDMQFAPFDAEELQKRIAELKKLIAQLVEVGNALVYPDGVFDDEQSEIEFKWHELVRNWKEAQE